MPWMTLVAFVMLTYVVARYSRIVTRIAETYAAYDGACCHEHSLYDVEASLRRLSRLQLVYVSVTFYVLTHVEIL
jgi:hypothetical protein